MANTAGSIDLGFIGFGNMAQTMARGLVNSGACMIPAIRVKHGLSRQTAYRLAAQMMMGTSKLYLETGAHPGAMKDAVCSPGGTTIKGVAALEKDGWRTDLAEARRVGLLRIVPRHERYGPNDCWG